MRPSLPRLPLRLMLSTCLLSACTSGPERPASPEINTAAAFSAPFPVTNTDIHDGEPWWRQAVADTIWPPLEQALSSNPELRKAQAEIDAARAQLSQAEADTGPSLVLGVLLLVGTVVLIVWAIRRYLDR